MVAEKDITTIIFQINEQLCLFLALFTNVFMSLHGLSVVKFLSMKIQECHTISNTEQY
jgi:hypothetical protein